MKKLIYISCIFLSIFVVVTNTVEISYENYNNILNNSTENKNFYLQEDWSLNDKEVYPILDKLSKKYNANIYKTSFNYENKNISILQGIIKKRNIVDKIATFQLLFYL